MKGKYKEVEESLRVDSFKDLLQEKYVTQDSPYEQIDSNHRLINWKEWTQ